MKKNRSRQHLQKSGTFQLVPEIELWHSGSEDALGAVLQTCTRLSIAERKQFIYLLLQQIFLPAGTACYLEFGERSPPNIRSVYLNLEDISETLADFWLEWASALSNEGWFCRPQEGCPVSRSADRAGFDRGGETVVPGLTASPFWEGLYLSVGLGDELGAYG